MSFVMVQNIPLRKVKCLLSWYKIYLCERLNLCADKLPNGVYTPSKRGISGLYHIGQSYSLH